MSNTEATPETEEVMEGGRLEAFSDGVIAVIITIMVLELKAPESHELAALLARWHIFAAYAVSFVLVAIYWVNHHHLLHIARRVAAPTLWFNIHWMFWLSLIPFVTSFVSESVGSPLSLALYGAIGAATAASYGLLAWDLSRRNQHIEVLQRVAKSRRWLILTSVAFNLMAIPMAYVSQWLAVLMILIPAMIFFIPARAVESANS